MSDFINNLRQKPEPERKIILVVGVSLCMIVIAGIWVFSLDKTIRSASEKGREIDKSGSQIVQGIKDIKNDLPTLWQSLGAGIGNILNSGENEIKIAPGQSASPSLQPSISAAPQEKLPVE